MYEHAIKVSEDNNAKSFEGSRHAEPATHVSVIGHSIDEKIYQVKQIRCVQIACESNKRRSGHEKLFDTSPHFVGTDFARDMSTLTTWLSILITGSMNINIYKPVVLCMCVREQKRNGYARQLSPRTFPPPIQVAKFQTEETVLP